MATQKRTGPTIAANTTVPAKSAGDMDGDVDHGHFGHIADQVTASEAHALKPQPAAQVALDRNSVRLPLPLGRSVSLPPPQHLAWYAGVGALAVLEIVEWPVAAVLAVGHLLVNQHQSKVLNDFGEALDHG